MEKQKLSTNEIIARGPTANGFLSTLSGKMLLVCIGIELYLLFRANTATSWMEHDGYMFGMFIFGFVTLLVAVYALGIFFQNCRGATLDYLNENNDGIYYHYCKDTSMLLDANKETLTLKNNKTEKTYSFADIREWAYEGHSSTTVLPANNSVAAGLNSLQYNISSAKTAIDKSGFFISVKDITNPVWKINFYPKKGSFMGDNATDNVKFQLKTWMEVFNQIVNKQ